MSGSCSQTHGLLFSQEAQYTARFTTLNSGPTTTSSALLTLTPFNWHNPQGGEHDWSANFTEEETEFVLLEGHRI